MFPWILAGVFALAAILLFLVWRRTAARLAATESGLAAAERSQRDLSLTVERATAQLQALLDAEPEPVLVLTGERHVAEMNAAARALFGIQAEAGQTLILATRSVELDELVSHCLAGGADCDRQVLLGRAGLPYRARAVPVSRSAGQAAEPAVVLVLQDLSELQRLGRARRDFVANISHELRTPITSIRLLVDTLQAAAPMAAAERADLLEKIAVETDTLAQLSQELLDLAQIESGQALLRLVPCLVAELVEHVTERLGPQVDRKQQRLRVDVPAELMALADPAQVTRVLGNLLHNAIKFAPSGGEIWVRAGQQDGDVFVEVGDTGSGIPPEDLPRVFERFYRGDRARASGGTGLGLAIAKHVVEAHGGRIGVESQGIPGQGAVFRFTLPAAEAGS